MPDYRRRGMLLCLVICMIWICCGCHGKQEQPEPTGPSFRIPEMPSIQYIPEETHPLTEEYKKQPNAYVAFTQTHQEPREGYVPRPAWQVWGARLGVVLMILFVIYQILSIARGGL